MNIKLNDIELNNINTLTLKKMIFIYNALEDGWKISKRKNKYVFSKKHENNKEIYLDSYLTNFIKLNLKTDDIQS